MYGSAVTFNKAITDKVSGKKILRFKLALQGGGTLTEDVVVRSGHYELDKFNRSEAKKIATEILLGRARNAGQAPKGGWKS